MRSEMEESEDTRNDLMQRLQSSFATSSSSIPKFQNPEKLEIPQLNTSQMRAPLRNFSPNYSSENKRIGIPPSHPHFPPASPYSSRSPAQPTTNSQSPGPHFGNTHSSPSHSRSLSQPAFFSLDSLPPLSPSPYRDSSSTSDPVSTDVSMEDRDTGPPNCTSSRNPPSPFPRPNSLRIGESFTPRKLHRRSHSEIPFGFSSSSSLGFSSSGIQGKESLGVGFGDQPGKLGQLVKREADWDRASDGQLEGMGERKSEGDVAEDLFSAYMNLDQVDGFNLGPGEKQCIESNEDFESGASRTKANGTKDNGNLSSSDEAESSSTQRRNSNSSTEKKEAKGEGNRGNFGAPHHSRSVSMDSFMGKMQSFGEDLKLPPSPGPTTGLARHSHSNSMDGSATFSLEFGNGEFSGAELKKIMANEKLAEIALTDPKRAKRILANRQSAARSKERKMRYISELEHKVQTLQTEATTLSAQLTLLQRDSAGLTNQNNELKFRLQAMEQQAQLKDALNEALTEEVQRLKLATAQLSEGQANNLAMKSQMFQMPQQPSQLSVYQLQQQNNQKHSGNHREGNQ
ncbi:probable transcription factor PosF21 isoform X1 [Amborella trichopoda]|uniref:BZIP domain-containing protein n=2 Tax=Amborella trichopoda TaxID=13333 RepID=U5D272_AMBTC|nr:probable transcription factor PosF21 isoform X1 [Amborella trichopoda]ERN14458.1 hypothetical protein AMTR_s00185p00050380 [Amborella trichopoda]|eukprot:XP_006852991.1 probable transcription factor PosF21 isoform X1 [Amborella trichopoda]